MTESREEAKIRLRGFVEEYVALCNKYEAEVLVNSYGVHCVETDAGLTFAFKSVYPEWDVDDEGEGEGSYGVDLAAPSADFTVAYMGDFGALEERMLMELSPHIPKDLTPEERETWKRENFHLLYGMKSTPIGKLVNPDET